MASHRSPQQVSDAASSAISQARPSLGQFRSAYFAAGTDPLSLVAQNKLGKDHDALAILEKFTDQRELVEQILQRDLDTANEVATVDRIRALYETIATKTPYHELIYTQLERMIAEDDALALYLYGLLSDKGQDALTERAERDSQIRELVESLDLESKNRSIAEIHKQIEVLKDHEATSRAAVEAQNMSMSILNLEKIRLETELAVRPTRFEIAGEQEDREKVVKDLVVDNYNLSAEDYPKKWSELKKLLDSVTLTERETFETKLQEHGNLSSEIDRKRRQAVEQLEREQKLHNRTKLSLDDVRSDKNEIQDKLRQAQYDKLMSDNGVSDQMRRVADLQKQLSAERSDVNDKEKAISAKEAEINRLKAKLDEFDDRIEVLDAELHDAKSASAAQAAQQGGDVQKWTKLYQTEAAKVAALEARIRHLEANARDATNQMEERQRQLLLESAKLQVAQKQYEMTERKVTNLESELANSRKTGDDLSAVVAQKDSELRLVQAEASRQAEQYSEGQKKLNTTIDQIRADYDMRASAESQRHKEQNNRHEEHLRDVKSQNQALVTQLQNEQAEATQHLTDSRQKSSQVSEKLRKAELDLQQLETKHNYAQASNVVHQENERKLQTQLNDAQVTNRQQEEIVRQLRDQLTQTTTESRTSEDTITSIRGDLQACRDERDEHAKRAAEAEQQLQNFVQIMTKYGSGNEIAVQDILAELTILDVLRVRSPLTDSEIKSRCQDWAQGFVYLGSFGQVTPANMWLKSISQPANMDLAILHAFVASNPTGEQLGFLQQALANTVKATSHLNFGQAMFVLRSLELSMMLLPYGVSQASLATLNDIQSKLPDTPLISTL